ncbi:MAG: DUF5367 family protein [Alphaproteobacteria bacterium]|nr:DUF5367 family protein [Alphaproteobacteria bacterium]
MIYHSIVGFIVWVLATLAFRFYGQAFFYPDILVVSILFIVAGPVLWGFMIVYLGVLNVLPENRALAAIAFVLPGMALDCLAIANFGLVFPNLDPSLDGLFGSLMLWAYGSLLFGGYSSDRRAKRKAARLLLERAGGE